VRFVDTTSGRVATDELTDRLPVRAFAATRALVAEAVGIQLQSQTGHDPANALTQLFGSPGRPSTRSSAAIRAAAPTSRIDAIEPWTIGLDGRRTKADR
jgi:hypothetical protein